MKTYAREVGLDLAAFEGKALRPVHHIEAFWFAWAAFNPETQLARE